MTCGVISLGKQHTSKWRTSGDDNDGDVHCRDAALVVLKGSGVEAGDA
jgi:hypothetical protein